MSRTPPTHLCVVGTTGSGKSTLARGIAARLGLAAVELDGLFRQADWQRAPRDDFRASCWRRSRVPRPRTVVGSLTATTEAT